MTRQEIEGFIIDKLKEIKEEYLKYNPEGKYMNLCINYGENGNDNGDWDCWTFSANNEHYEGSGHDHDRPVDVWAYEDVKDEQYYRCNPEEDDAV